MIELQVIAVEKEGLATEYRLSPDPVMLGAMDSHYEEKLHLTLPESWAGRTVRVTFTPELCEGVGFVLDDAGCVPVTAAFSGAAPRGVVTVEALETIESDGETAVRKTFSRDVRYRVTPHAASGEPPEEITPTQFEQFITNVTAATKESVQAAESYMNEAETYATSAGTARNEANTAKSAAESAAANAAGSAEAAATSATNAAASSESAAKAAGQAAESASVATAAADRAEASASFFVAQHGVTTFDEILEAYKKGMVITCQYYTYTGYLFVLNETAQYAQFYTHENDDSLYKIVCHRVYGWTNTRYTHVTQQYVDEQVAAIDLTDYVKNTDYAQANNDTGGVVRMAKNGNYGLYMANDSTTIAISKATNGELDAKSSIFKPVVAANLDYAVKVGLTTNTETLTAEEKAAVQKWLGMTMATNEAKPWTVVQRSTDGVIYVGTPTSDGHAATKGYVDDLIAELAARIAVLEEVSA